MQIQCAAMHAQQNADVNHHGYAGHAQRQPVQRLAAAQQGARQPARRDEVEHDGEQGENVDDHGGAVSHRLRRVCMRGGSLRPL